MFGLFGRSMYLAILLPSDDTVTENGKYQIVYTKKWKGFNMAHLRNS